MQPTDHYRAVTVDDSGETLARMLSEEREAMLTDNSGPTPPSYAHTGTPWLDTGVTPPMWRKFVEGTGWVPVGYLDVERGVWVSPGLLPSFGADLVGYMARTAAAHMQDMPNIKDFGAQGDGWADDSPAFLAALEAAIESGRGCVWLPDGDFVLDSCVAIAFSTAAVRIQGAGAGVTVLHVPATNTTGALHLAASSRTSEITLADFSVAVYGANPCTVLAVTQPPGGSQDKRNAVLRNLRIYTPDIYAHHWGTAIDLAGCWRPLVDNVYVSGPWGPGVGDDYSNTSLQYAATCCLNLDGCYGPLVRDSYLWCAQVGISSVGTTEEGFMMTGTIINHVLKGIYYKRDSPEPLFKVTDFHINARDRGIEINGAKLVTISKGLFYNQDLQNLSGATPYDIHLTNWLAVNLEGNEFHFDGHPSRVHILLTDDDPITGENGVRIVNTLFNATAATGIQIEADVAQISISGSMWTGTYVNRIVDNSGRAVIAGPSPYNANSWLIENADPGATAAPGLDLMRRSASPAANDITGNVRYWGWSLEADGTTLHDKMAYAQARTVIIDPLYSTASGAMEFWTVNAGTQGRRGWFGNGFVLGAATGGDKGAGTLNMYGDLYHQGTKVVGAQQTGWTASTGTALKGAFDTSTATLAQCAQRIKALQDALAAHGLINA